MDECSVVAMECTPDRDLLLIQIPVAKMKRSIRECYIHTGLIDTNNLLPPGHECLIIQREKEKRVLIHHSCRPVNATDWRVTHLVYDTK